MRRAALGLLIGVLAACDRGGERGASSSSAPASASASAVAGVSASAASSAAAPPAPPPIDAGAIAKQVSASCQPSKATAIFFSPAEPSPDAPVRVMATTHEQGHLGLVVVPPGGAPTAPAVEERLGPPRSLFASVADVATGKLRVIVVRDGQPAGCRDIEVKTRPAPEHRAFGGRPWKLERAWDKDAEDLFSAWIEKLFDVKESEPLSVPALHELTRDPARNFLFNHLGLGEDEPAPKGLRLDPDCADLPYTLRAYFSFKLGLPFAFSSCTRGTRQNAPRCLKRASSLDKIDEAPRERVRRMDRFVRVRLADTVHSGTARTKADDDFTDYYPIALSRETLRPGAIFADPYGHILVVARRVPQTADRAGALFAIDGQPDGTVAKKRFWQGNFLFSTAEPAMGSPGFKRFRPVVVMGDEIVTLDNAQIAADRAYGDFSLAQATMDERAFYDAMDDLLSPEPLDPERAMAEAVRALHEQAEARVTSVENGEKHFRQGGGRIEMPDGAAIFETTGDWEDYSTPSRDLRLLIAIDVVTGFPSLVGRRPERFKMPAGQTKESIVAALEATLQKSLRDATLTYSRSDASPFTITLADLVARKRELEVAYHPDDCPEVRWGATPGSDEISTCRRRATGGDRAKMEGKFRGWFRDRRRPPRGG